MLGLFKKKSITNLIGLVTFVKLAKPKNILPVLVKLVLSYCYLSINVKLIMVLNKSARKKIFIYNIKSHMRVMQKRFLSANRVLISSSIQSLYSCNNNPVYINFSLCCCTVVRLVTSSVSSPSGHISAAP